MKVRALFSPDVLTAHTGEDLAVVASRMQYQEVGALAVFDGDDLVGIITERDVLRAMADGRNAETTTVSEYMTSDPITIGPEDEASRAAALMLDLGARHLPVEQGGRVVGMLSARDLLSLGGWDEPQLVSRRR